MTTPTTEQPSTSIQLWPSGDSVEFRGDPDGPPAQRAIRRRNERNECRTRPWTTGDDDLWRALRIARRAEGYAEREIYVCDSMLVSDLLQADALEGFQADDLRNLYPDPSDWDLEECRAYLSDAGLDTEPDADLDDLRSTIRDDAAPAEVYEWWRVSTWFCRQLDEIGEVTISNGYGCWWGRSCTGQNYICDGTLQCVAARFEEGS